MSYSRKQIDFEVVHTRNYSQDIFVYCYHLQTSFAKVMFSQASVILLTGGGLPQCMLGYTPLGADTPQSRHPQSRHPPSRHPPEQTPQVQTPPRADTPLPQSRHLPPQSRHPPGADSPPPQSMLEDAEIRSKRGQYASYWNAILLYLC